MKEVIFVTVGSGKFDKLVKVIDRNVEKIKEEIIIQIGEGEYIPKNCKFFRYDNNIEKYYKEAKLVITHGGAGTIFYLLGKNKKIIGVANLDRTDSHQKEILEVLSKEKYLIWCKDLNKIIKCIEKAKRYKFKKYTPPRCDIHKKIEEFLKCVEY